MIKNYHSELLGAIHETALGLYKIGVIDAETMREYDEDCLVPELEGEAEPVEEAIAAFKPL
jgi:DNA-binding transcriptional regulator YiaG